MAGHVFAAGKGLCKASGLGPEKNLLPWELVQKPEQHKTTVLCCKAEGMLNILPVGASMGLYHLAHGVITQPKTCKYVQAYNSNYINGIH